jgi:hypothetical protein
LQQFPVKHLEQVAFSGETKTSDIVAMMQWDLPFALVSQENTQGQGLVAVTNSLTHTNVVLPVFAWF